MTDPLALLAPIRARLAAATPGPWEWIGSNLERCSPGYGDVLEVEVECGSYCYGGSPRMNISAGNKALLENAPTDLARLLAAIEAVESTAKYLDKLADGDRHYANLFRQAVAAGLGSDTTNQEGTQ